MGDSTNRLNLNLLASLSLPTDGSIRVEGRAVHFVKVAPRKFFGFKTYDTYGRKATISTPSKTLLDCVDRPELAGGPAEVARITHGASTVVSPEELADTAFQMKSTATMPRLGFQGVSFLPGSGMLSLISNRYLA